jgi:hippurate hydrolase
LANDEKLAKRLDPVVRQAIGQNNVEEAEPTMGGEDFGAFGRAGVPILMMGVGAVNANRMERYKKEGGAPSLHSPKFFPDIEPTMTTGVAALASASLELLRPDDAEKK